jgi:predicted RNA-binding protein YlqC (UPF0109 family)
MMSAEAAEVQVEGKSAANKAMTHIVGVLTQFAMAFATHPDNLRVEVKRKDNHLTVTVFCHPQDTGRMRGAKQMRIVLMMQIAHEIATRFQIHVGGIKIRACQPTQNAGFAAIEDILPTLEVVDMRSGRRRRIVRPH